MAAEERDLHHDTPGEEPAAQSGSHPVGTGVGAAGGAVAGAAAGMAAGPLGMAVGGVAGAVIGGLAGKAVAEAYSPEAEDAHWRERYTQEPYYQSGRSYDDYGPAYRYGAQSRASGEDDWDTAATRLESGWEGARGSSTLGWEDARPASRAAWDRMDSRRTQGQASDGSSTSYDSAEAHGLTGSSASSSASTSGTSTGSSASSGTTGAGGIGAAVGEAQQAGDNSGSREDAVDVLKDLLECCKDGEYGFNQCADNTRRDDLKSVFQQRAEDCRRGAQELKDKIRACGGQADEDSGSALGAVHRGWVSVRATLTTLDDQAMLDEAERGEDNALARYRKALQKPLPQEVRDVVERQLQGVQRNHDQITMLRNQMRAAS